MDTGGCLDESVNQTRIDASAKIIGRSFLTGSETRVGPGAVIENSYIENAVVEAGARVVDSILTTSGSLHTHNCDAASRWVSGGSKTAAGKDAELQRSVLINSTVGPGSKCSDSCLEQCTIGAGCDLSMMKGVLVTAGDAVTVHGPTEVSEAWLGHHTTLDRCGYFEGVFSNEFHVIEFDETSGSLRVLETLDLPHVSRYGMNSVHSTNSGKLLPQPDGKLVSFGPLVKLWHDPLLSHEPIMLGPCCWVGGWTKVIGQSAKSHASNDELIADALATNLMPFAVGGLDGETVWGRVAPGERFDGPDHRKRRPAWAFIYAPGAVINMVRRLYEALPAGDCEIADSVVTLSIRNALAIALHTARERDIDLAALGEKRARGWTGWLLNAKNTFDALLALGLWEFKEGRPLQWEEQDGRWVPLNPDALLAIAPDAIENQVSESDILRDREEPLAHRLGVDAEELGAGETSVSEEAQVAPDAFIGPGVRITGRSVIESGALLWRTVIREGRVGRDTRVLRSVVSESSVGTGSEVISAYMQGSAVGPESNVLCARMEDSKLAECATVSPFGNLRDVTANRAVILGGCMEGADIRTVLMSMHMAGSAAYINASPAQVNVEGRTEEVWVVPMLGGGSRILGTVERPVGLEGAFIGSNAIIEAGAYVGFGSFVLGRLTGEEGLPPFTVSTSAGHEGDGIGNVLIQFTNLIITHMIGWAYQAGGTEQAPAVAGLIRSQIEEGARVLRWALETRGAWDDTSPFARFKSLRLYSEGQLQAGIETYQRELDEDRWLMAFTNGELRFTGEGAWSVSDGAARWL